MPVRFVIPLSLHFANVILGETNPSANGSKSKLNLEKVNDVKKCLLEKLEELLPPNSTSLYLFVQCPQGPKNRKIKDIVTEILDQYAPYNFGVIYY